jgi:hypothetical protein
MVQPVVFSDSASSCNLYSGLDLDLKFDFYFDHSLVLDPAVGCVNSFDYALIVGLVHTMFLDSYGESQCFSSNNQLDFNFNDILLCIKFSNVNIACKFLLSLLS